MTMTGYQGLTEAQSELVDYWHGLCRRAPAGPPRRQDIDAGALRTHLAHLSIVEVTFSGAVRFRLAGSALREMAGMNLQGRQLDALPTAVARIWQRGLQDALVTQAPAGGFDVPAEGSHCHAWLRMPLEDGASNGRVLLCHDRLVFGADERDTSSVPALILGLNSSIAA